MAEYYLHKAGHQELGSIGADGKPQRGRYFLVSKSCLDFFPHLSSVIMNDSILLTVISMFPDRQSEKVVCTLDYHNQKHAVFNYTGKHPRDEYRFYLNNNIDPNLYYKAGDIVVFEKIITNDGELIYSLTRIPNDHPNYNDLDKIINDFKASRGGHALYNGVLDFIKKPEITENEIITVSEKAAAVINKVSDDLAHKEENSEEDSDGDLSEEVYAGDIITPDDDDFPDPGYNPDEVKPDTKEESVADEDTFLNNDIF